MIHNFLLDTPLVTGLVKGLVVTYRTKYFSVTQLAIALPL